MVVAPLLSLFLVASAATDEPSDPEVGRPAPEAGFRSFLRNRWPDRHEVAAFRGEVLILHSFAWNCSSCLRVGIPLAVELQRTAGARGLNVLSVTTPAYPEETRRVAEELGLANPIALENPLQNESPYVDASKNPITYFFVIGRNGELVWRGDPSSKTEECLEAIARALDAPADLALDPPLHDELAEAGARWYEGDLAGARKLAAKLAARHGKRSKGDSPRIAADAQRLLGRIDALGKELLARLEAAHEARDALAMVRLAERLAGLGKDPLAGRARELLEVAADDEALAADLAAAAAWRELERTRPALFPARREREEKRWAKELRRFLDRHPAGPGRSEAEALLASWSAG